MKATNKARKLAAEPLEQRPVTEENASPTPTCRTQSREQVSRALARIRAAARSDKGRRFNNLLSHITPELLRESFYHLKRKAATGVDEVSWEEYQHGLDKRLEVLHERVHGGTYRAQPSKRIYIPKADGRQRPIGIAALEDKIVQQAVVRILGAIYETDFKGFSYGFRAGKSQHDALDALWMGITTRKVNWVVDADIRSFFDTLDHTWLMKFLAHRISDRRLLRLVGKWLKAGISEDGQWSATSVGTPQGAVISPLLANVYLHYVLDLWVEQWRKRNATGNVIVVRYADDFVMGFQHKREAQWFMMELKERLKQFGLELHETKTRLIEFGRFAMEWRNERGQRNPETFDFLGFTHMCVKRRTDGRFTVARQPIAKRLRTKAKAVKEQLRRMMCQPLRKQGAWLKSVLQGVFNYAAVPGTKATLETFRRYIIWLWRQTLRRRSQTRHKLTWRRMHALTDRWIPSVRIVHPYPNQRWNVTHPR